METPRLLRLSILTLFLAFAAAWYASINEITASCAQIVSIKPEGSKLHFVASFESEPRKDAAPVQHYKGPLEPPTNY
jgi:hypothetical protein